MLFGQLFLDHGAHYPLGGRGTATVDHVNVRGLDAFSVLDQVHKPVTQSPHQRIFALSEHGKAVDLHVTVVQLLVFDAFVFSVGLLVNAPGGGGGVHHQLDACL